MGRERTQHTLCEVHDVTQIFLNYRGADEPYGAAMLDEHLSRRFGSPAVFLCSKSILLGTLWEKEMFDAIAASDAVLVVIGRKWLDATDDDGNRSIDNPEDFVRREILQAAELNKKIIPVLLARKRLTTSELPSELAVLAEYQDIEVRYRNSRIDLDRLTDRLTELIPELRRQHPEKKSVGSPTTNNNYSTGTIVSAERMKFGTFNAGLTVHNHGPNRDTDHE
jgi:hypothetical protein